MSMKTPYWYKEIEKPDFRTFHPGLQETILRQTAAIGKERRPAAPILRRFVAAAMLGILFVIGLYSLNGIPSLPGVNTASSPQPLDYAQREILWNLQAVFSIPKNWDVKETDPESLSFMKNGKKIGGFRICDFPDDSPIASLLPGQARIISFHKADSFPFLAYQAFVGISEPVTRIPLKERHYLVPLPSRHQGYDLYVNDEQAPQPIGEWIAKSLRVLVDSKTIAQMEWTPSPSFSADDFPLARTWYGSPEGVAVSGDAMSRLSGYHDDILYLRLSGLGNGKHKVTITGVNRDTHEEATLLYQEELPAQGSLHVAHARFPDSGLWNLRIDVDGKLYGSVVVHAYVKP